MRYFGDKFTFRSKRAFVLLKTHGKLLISLIRRYRQEEQLVLLTGLPLRIFEFTLLAWFLKKLLGNSVSYLTCLFWKVLLLMTAFLGIPLLYITLQITRLRKLAR